MMLETIALMSNNLPEQIDGRMVPIMLARTEKCGYRLAFASRNKN
jgi:hypothetical protein